MMNPTLYAIIIGLVQGISEFLPISSSGHLVLISDLMMGKTMPLSLEIALHIGTLTAVFIYFARDWLSLGLGTLGLAPPPQVILQRKLMKLLLVGSIPAGLIGVIFKDMIEKTFHHPISVVLPLAIIGFVLWYVDKKSSANKTFQQISGFDALLIGVAQACALIPGVSRSGATMAMSRGLGFNRTDAAKFSFMLGTPAMCGAALLEIKHFYHEMFEPTFFIGCITSCITGCLVIHFFLKMMNKINFLHFAVYRLLVALFIVFYLFMK